MYRNMKFFIYNIFLQVYFKKIYKFMIGMKDRNVIL